MVRDIKRALTPFVYYGIRKKEGAIVTNLAPSAVLGVMDHNKWKSWSVPN